MDIQRSDIPHIKPVLINYLKFSTARSEKSLQLEENVKDNAETEIEALTEKIIATEGKNPEDIEEIILPGRGIARIEDFDRLTKLQYLNVSFNKLTKLSGLEKCVELKTIDASYNRLTYIEGLHVLNNLKAILLHNNAITKLNDVYTLKFNATLKELSIRGNPFTFIRGYKGQLLQLLPGISTLDGKTVR